MTTRIREMETLTEVKELRLKVNLLPKQFKQKTITFLPVAGHGIRNSSTSEHQPIKTSR